MDNTRDREVAVTAEPQPGQALAIAANAGTGVLDHTPWLLDELDAANAALGYWKKRVDDLKDAIRDVAGEKEELVLHGKTVFTYARIATFRQADFAKAHPDLFKAYQHTVETSELDVDLLKHAKPDLYREFQTRQLRRVV